MSDRFQDLSLFVRVADTGSFSRAGRELGYSQPTVSRIVGAMEQRLGVKLLMRTTRKVTLTEAGQILLERARTVLSELEDAENAARGASGLTGVLRVATPVTFGAREIAPVLGPFLDAHPELRVELLMADRRVDLLEEGVDLAIRLGALPDSSFVSRRLASAPQFLVASPAYLDRCGEPTSPAELSAHHIVATRQAGSVIWRFRDPAGGETSVKLAARLATTATEGTLAAVVNGLGLATLSAFGCRAELAQGRLRRLLANYRLPPIDVHAVFPSGRQPPAKSRAFLDHLVPHLNAGLRAEESWEPPA